MATDKRAPKKMNIEESPRPAVLSAIALAALIVVSLVICAGFVVWLQREGTIPNPAPKKAQLPPEPRLEATPSETLERVRREEHVRANTYGWIDRKNGVIRVPVARAMELMLEREGDE